MIRELEKIVDKRIRENKKKSVFKKVIKDKSLNITFKKLPKLSY